MLKKYYPLFQLDFKHNFYADGVFKDLELQPSQETTNLLRQYDLLPREVKSGYAIYYAQKGENTPNIKLIEDQIKLVFAIKVTNPFLFNFTNLNPADSNQNMFYFSNVGKGASTTDSIVLSTNNLVTDTDRIPFEPASYIANLIAEYKNKKTTEEAFDFTIEDQFEEEVLNSTEILEDGFSLPHLPNGKYTIKKSTSNPESFYLSTNLKTNEIIGLIEIHIGKLPNEESHILNDQNINHQVYHLQFSKRATLWRYYLIPGQDSNIKNFEILNTKNIPEPANKAPLFETSKTLKDLGGQKAYVISSTVPIPLLEKDDAYFSLKLVIENQSNGREISNTLHLPNPDYQMLKAEVASDDSENKTNVFYSDVYFYI